MLFLLEINADNSIYPTFLEEKVLYRTLKGSIHS